jgi:dTDP-4-amino-4,6-dideoxygalactose transaminase
LQEIINKRKEISLLYVSELQNLRLTFLKVQDGTTLYNYAYFPVVFESEEQLIRVTKALNDEQIAPRRYFYPSLNTLNYVENNLVKDLASEVSKRVLCLPLYPQLAHEEVIRIVKVIRSVLC